MPPSPSPPSRIQVGSTLLFRNWFWVVDRRINDSWRLRSLKTGQFLCLPQSEVRRAILDGHCALVATSGATEFERLEFSDLRRLVLTLMSLN